MARIIREERRERGFFGSVLLVLFWVFNAYMCYALVAGLAAVSGSYDSSVGATIGTGLGVAFLLFIWVAGAVILGLLALFTRGSKTVIIEDTIGGGPDGGAAALPPGLDTSKWSPHERAAYERSQAAKPVIDGRARREPTVASEPLALPPVASPVRRGADELESAVTALKVLANAGAGFDAGAIEATMEYLEAAEISSWMQALPADDAAIRAASLALPQAVRAKTAFLQAMTTIMGNKPTELQNRWFAALKRQTGVV